MTVARCNRAESSEGRLVGWSANGAERSHTAVASALWSERESDLFRPCSTLDTCLLAGEWHAGWGLSWAEAALLGQIEGENSMK